MWNNLSLKEKAELIQAGMKAGYRDIDSIRERFNSFSKGNYQEPIIQRTQEQLPVENVENSDYSVVPKLNYYKDPNETANKFDKGGKKSNFIDFITGHKEEKKQAAKEAAEWTKKYYQSEGFKERMEKLPHYYNQYREQYYPNYNYNVSFDYTLPEDPEFKFSNTKPSSYNTENDVITVGTRKNPEDYYKIINHELGHKYAKGVKTNIDTEEGTVTFEGGHYNYYPVFREGKQYQEALNNLTKADKRQFETYPEFMAEKVHHDALPGENYADLISLRAELDKANIYDSNKSNNVFTKEHLDKAREQGITSRLFDNFDDDAVILMMNDVAHTLINDSGNNYAANGGRLFNKFDDGGNYTVGNLVDAIYQNNPKEEYLGKPSHNYDFTQSEEWADAHGYYPDTRGHRDDRVKKPAHPSHPSRGTWQGDNFILTDKGFEDPNYTLFGLNDGGQDPQATLIYDDGVVLPEITVTSNSKYINNSYDNIRLHLKSNGGKINRF